MSKNINYRENSRIPQTTTQLIMSFQTFNCDNILLNYQKFVNVFPNARKNIKMPFFF